MVGGTGAGSSRQRYGERGDGDNMRDPISATTTCLGTSPATTAIPLPTATYTDGIFQNGTRTISTGDVSLTQRALDPQSWAF